MTIRIFLDPESIEYLTSLRPLEITTHGTTRPTTFVRLFPVIGKLDLYGRTGKRVSHIHNARPLERYPAVES